MTVLAFDAAPLEAATEACAHCGLPALAGRRFCCPGCAAAFDTIQSLGLGSFYERCIAERPPRPERSEHYDLTRFIASRADGTHELVLAVDGLRCGACVWLIESVLAREASVLIGRVNMTSRRLKLVWRGPEAEADRLVGRIEALGYRLMPFDPVALAAARDDADRELLKALAVAGFAAINVMLMSIGIWAGDAAGLLDSMGPATRDLLHYVSALIALPAIAYAGQPFFRSAVGVLRHGRTNMDVPISVGVVLVTGLSLAQTLSHGRDTYFDSAVTLLFFLLIGRVLDHRARGQVRATVELLLTLRSTDVTVLAEDGTAERRPARALVPGDRVLVGMGERIGVDGVVERGESSVDTSLVTGESLPVSVAAGGAVFAGTMNLGGAADRACYRDRGRNLAGGVCSPDRGVRGAAVSFRRARRSGGATVCAGGTSDRAGDVCGVVCLGWCLVSPGAADGERGADRHVPLRAGVGGAGGAGDRHG